MRAPGSRSIIHVEDGSLVVLVGPAGAGKTTFARARFGPTEILSSDAFRAMLADDEADQSINPAAFDLLRRALAVRLGRGLLTVIDATNLRHDVRRDLVRLAEGAGRPAVAVAFDLPEATCEAQNRRRPGRSVPSAVVTRHLGELRRTLDGGWLAREGFDAVHVLRSTREIDETTIERAVRSRVRQRRAATARLPHDGAMSETTANTKGAGTGAAAGGAAARTTGAAAAIDIGPRTDRTRIRRKPDRAVPEHIEAILRAGQVAHVAFVHEGEPRVIPFLYGYEAGRIVLHGAPGSSTLRELRDGRPVAVAVTILDALIASKDAETHSANYRSVVAYGTARRITAAAEKRRILVEMTGRYFPGRTVDREYAAATEQQIRAMEVVEVVVEEAAAKARSGPPLGPHDADDAAPGKAGIYPLTGLAPD